MHKRHRLINYFLIKIITACYAFLCENVISWCSVIIPYSVGQIDTMWSFPPIFGFVGRHFLPIMYFFSWRPYCLARINYSSLQRGAPPKPWAIRPAISINLPRNPSFPDFIRLSLVDNDKKCWHTIQSVLENIYPLVKLPGDPLKTFVSSCNWRRNQKSRGLLASLMVWLWMVWV